MSRIQITKCEAEVMDVVWDRQSVTVNDVLDAIDRDLAYTTVLTTMRILEEKGIVRRGKKISRAYTYSPAVTREEVRLGMIHELSDRLFGGSIQSLVLSLLNSDSISPEDLKAVQNAANQAERRQ